MLKRRRYGMSQAELAYEKELSQMTISNFERGVRDIPAAMFSPRWFIIEPKNMTKAENLRMFRMRRQLSVKEMAEKMLVSKVTYTKMEAGIHKDYCMKV